jgi:hypothetical protein
MQYDIAELLEVKDTGQFLKYMQDEFEGRIGPLRFFRISATPGVLGRVSAALDDSKLLELLQNPPNPHARFAGWDAKPLPPLRRSALGLENERVDFHHMKFVKNGHLEFWTEIDESFCWQQDRKEMKEHPRLYPYAVVEHPVSFCRLYRALADHLGVDCDVVFQMQYWNIQGAYMLPYHPESIGFAAPVERIRPLERQRLLFQAKRFPATFDPDPSALEVIKDLYYEFGYGREHIPFFDAEGHCRL